MVAEWKTIGKGKGTAACSVLVEAIVLRTLRLGAILGGALTVDCKGGTDKRGFDSGRDKVKTKKVKCLKYNIYL